MNQAAHHPELTFLSFGEILWDIIEGTHYLGGAPFNVAAHLARCGASSYMLSRVGQDALGDRAVAEAQQLGVHTGLIQRDPQHPTGTVDVYLEAGQPDYTIHPEVAWDYITADPTQLQSRRFRGFYFGTLAQRHPASRQALRWILDHLRFDTVFFDVNLRKGVPLQTLLSASLPHCQVLKLNQDEVTVLSELLFRQSLTPEAFARTIRQQYLVEAVIITAGDQGCDVLAGEQWRRVPGQPVQVVDAVGAGDAFSAAFLWKYLQGHDAFQAAATANQLGAFVAASRGAIPTYSDKIKHIINP